MREKKQKSKAAALLLLTALCLLWGAADGFAQTADKRISYQCKDKRLPAALKAVERLSGYYKMQFGYTDINQYTVTADIKNLTAPEAVKRLISGLPLTSEVKSRYITVTVKKGDSRQISGTVTDNSGEPLTGATVYLKGAKRGAITDANGRYTISVRPGEELSFSYIGMETKSIVYRGGSSLDVELTPNSTQLNDVVVVGYGTQRRKDLTGSVSSVDARELKELPAITVDDALAGRASGVQVTKADGTPGGAVRIRIRGGASLSGSADPLYVIDGVPTEIKNNYISSTDIVNPIEAANCGEDFGNSVSGSFMRGLNSLAGLNINDIESINILKDASATAIYGSKAANGVVIITTKRGKTEQKPRFDLNYYYSFSTPKKEKLLNGEQYISALKESLSTSQTNLDRNKDELSASKYNSSVKVIQEKLATLESVGNANTDWLDLILRTGHTHNIDFSVNGGGNRSRYYAAFGYSTQDGTLINTDFDRYTGKVNLDTEVSKRFRMGTSIGLSYSKSNITNGVYGQALSSPPVLPVYNDDGSYADYSKLGGVGASYMGFQNPLAVAQCVNLAKTYSLKGSVFGEYDILKELKLKSVLSLDYQSYNQVNYIPSYVTVNSYYGAEDSEGGQGTNAQRTSTSVYWENTLTFDKTFGEIHRLNAMVGHTWEQQQSDYFSASGKGYPDDKYLNNLSSAQTATNVKGANPDYKISMLSFYARFNYTLLDRYLFTFTGRSDASSKFSKAHRVGYFPSGAIAWRLKEESWLRDVKWVDELKIRASIGKTGTQNVSDYMFLTLYSPGSYAGSSALYPTQLGNDEIKWESTVQKDLGLDFSFFNGRLGGTFGYYHKITDGALLSVPTAPSSGYSTIISNIAKIRNIGVEFDLYGDIVRNKTWRWTASLNITHNSSKCLHIEGNLFSNDDERSELNLGTSVFKEGESLGLLCGYKVKGLIETQEQLDDYKSRFTSWSSMAPDLGIGSYEFELNESGMYYQDVIGNSSPDFYGGFTTTLQYKNWALSTHFTFSYGNDMIYQKDVNDMSFSSMGNRGVRVLEASSADNYTGRPLSTYNTTYMLSNLNVYDASYLKCQSISLTWNLPQRCLKQLRLTNLQLYATASNLFTFTSYPGPDPAVSDDPYSIVGGGRDASTYPTVRSFTFGIRLGF